jgi:hypothetical protein
LLTISSKQQKRSAGQLNPPKTPEDERVDLEGKDIKDGQEGKA